MAKIQYTSGLCKLAFSTLLFTAATCILHAQQPYDADAVRSLLQVQGVQISFHRSTGVPAFMLWPADAPLDLPGVTLPEKSDHFFRLFGRVFGITNPDESLRLDSQTSDYTRYTRLKYQQIHEGVEVFGGELLLHFDSRGALHAVNGVYVPEIRAAVAGLHWDTASVKAIALEGFERLPDSEYADKPLKAEITNLYIYRTGLAQGLTGTDYPAYEVELSDTADLRVFAYVDAVKGEIVEFLPGTCSALSRKVYHTNLSTQAWQEGDPFPGALNIWKQNMVAAAGHMYYLFYNLSGRDSYNHGGAEMRAVDNAPLSCPNASWNGSTTRFCNGTASDDVVAHEWGHAYTEYGPNLIYAWQAGALNESYSDIWGEVVDLINAYEDTGEDLSLRTGCGSSLRWMMGEDATAFGGAIRDMWDPQCKNHPGKASDGNYRCDSGDNGGVHSNSGIPNHLFALLTDGGAYNGHVITGLGLTKTVHLFHRASQYLTRTSDFDNMADALQSACFTLTGINLEGLSVSATPAGPSGEIISAADCNEVAKGILAVELRATPPCSFTPLLDPSTPAICPAGTTPTNIYSMDFESGTAGWTTTGIPTNPSTWTPRFWYLNSFQPKGRPGAGVTANNPFAGDCNTNLENGIQRLQSPVISIPGAATATLRLSFDHMLSLENLWDGGNLKYSINSGAWMLVPASAFVFNPYNNTLQPASSGNDNPLAGELAFTGANTGSVSGSWGQSQINLTALGIMPGDNVQFRWELGEDGCNGWDAWYLDDVVVCQCESVLPVTLTTFTATAQQNLILLQWTTASEQNNAGFEVQRRDGADSDFKTIAWAPGHINRSSKADYALPDPNVKPGLTYYYRLRQLDLDGKAEYSGVVSAKLPGGAAPEWHVFPNPAKESLQVRIQGAWRQTVHLYLYDVIGRPVIVRHVETNGDFISSIHIPLQGLPPGIYLLHASDGDTTLSQRVSLLGED